MSNCGASAKFMTTKIELTNRELRDKLEEEEIRERYGALRSLSKTKRELDEIIASNTSKMGVNEAALERIKMNYRKQYGDSTETFDNTEIWGMILYAMRKTWIIAIVMAFLI